MIWLILSGSKKNGCKDWNVSPSLAMVRVIWYLLENGDAEPVRIQNPVANLDYAKRELIEARIYEIPAKAIEEDHKL
ncbi:hypothetical protein JXL19_06080 [bacterium]|nr:hypothetical protein [bacterium]